MPLVIYMTFHSISSDEEFNEMITKGGPVLIDFYATWCGPCVRVAPLLEEMSNIYPSVQFVKVDIDKHPGLAGEYEITSIPTIILFIDGKLVQRIGGTNVEQIEEMVKKAA
eukprot:GHVP01062789.1.p1 GENE.GHVP01062789.1~~GHVP01062789.1.p1  ORF type:complete len:111 (-),score=19.45 GHVP01062789.1:592-924(-)